MMATGISLQCALRVQTLSLLSLRCQRHPKTDGIDPAFLGSPDLCLDAAPADA
ncbi:MAG: hypothetical protein H6Q00_3540 [Holophagaceae bacterium]|nr:hypothetical protein [Holophagaceae bacterium]